MRWFVRTKDLVLHWLKSRISLYLTLVEGDDCFANDVMCETVLVASSCQLTVTNANASTEYSYCPCIDRQPRCCLSWKRARAGGKTEESPTSWLVPKRSEPPI